VGNSSVERPNCDAKKRQTDGHQRDQPQRQGFPGGISAAYALRKAQSKLALRTQPMTNGFFRPTGRSASRRCIHWARNFAHRTTLRNPGIFNFDLGAKSAFNNPPRAALPLLPFRAENCFKRSTQWQGWNFSAPQKFRFHRRPTWATDQPRPAAGRPAILGTFA